MSESPPDTRNDRLNLSWLVKLRWAALLGQIAAVITVASLMTVSVDLGAASGLLALLGLSNLVLHFGRARVSISRVRLAGGVLALDVAALTGLLALSGGASNPFSFLYVLYIAIAALMLRGYRPWLVAGLAIAGYGSLYLGGIELSHDTRADHGDVHGHLYGMWVAMAVTGGMIAYFINLIRTELEDRRRRLEEMREVRARRDKLASLATVAAGAAHELSTPISTIAVVADEMSHCAREQGADELAEDADVIGQEAEQCREILDKMAAESGHRRNASFQTMAVGEIVDAARRRAPEPSRVDVECRVARSTRVDVPVEAFVDNVVAVLDNGFRASSEDQTITLEIRKDDEGLAFVVRDEGRGMSPKERRHAVEPFFSTRAPDEGMGLGLYLVREFLEGVEGTMRIESLEGEGTEVYMCLPDSHVQYEARGDAT